MTAQHPMKAVKASIDKLNDAGFCSWTVTGKIRGPYRLLARPLVKVRSRDGREDKVRVSNLTKLKGGSYVADVHPEDLAEIDKSKPWVVPPADVMPDIPRLTHLGRLALLELYESIAGTRAMLALKRTMKGMKNRERRECVRSAILEMKPGPAPRVGPTFSALCTTLAELTSEEHVQKTLAEVQNAPTGAERCAHLAAAIERARA
jgi:hypothetical protein